MYLNKKEHYHGRLCKAWWLSTRSCLNNPSCRVCMYICHWRSTLTSWISYSIDFPKSSAELATTATANVLSTNIIYYTASATKTGITSGNTEDKGDRVIRIKPGGMLTFKNIQVPKTGTYYLGILTQSGGPNYVVGEPPYIISVNGVVVQTTTYTDNEIFQFAIYLKAGNNSITITTDPDKYKQTCFVGGTGIYANEDQCSGIEAIVVTSQPIDLNYDHSDIWCTILGTC
jgi:hypothetical protein